MNFDINVGAGLLAGVAAMIPGSIIYSPNVPTGKRWMKEVNHKPGGGGSPAKAVGMMLIVSLINGLVASAIVSTAGAETFAQIFGLTMLVGWFLVSASLMLVFFERRSWAWLGISALSHVLTFAVIGIVLGLLN
jgi:Protein of unknown function (DUF1761)